MASEQFSLCWDNFHKNMSSGMNSLLESEDLVDVTLAVDGKYLKAHKMVLSVCSPYFRELFKVNPCKHPIVFLKDVSYVAMSDLLQFMYQGEVQVSQENLTTFIKTAEALQIKGLTGDGNGTSEGDSDLLDEQQSKVIEVPMPKPTPIRQKRSQSQQQHQILTPQMIKKPRVSSPPAKSLTVSAKTEAITPIATAATTELIQFKMEPSEGQGTVVPDDNNDDTFDENLDETGDETAEEYSMMEAGDDEPQAGTSADGAPAGEGQVPTPSKSDSSKFLSISDVEIKSESEDEEENQIADETAAEISLIPNKSGQLYQKRYNKFMEWCFDRGVTDYTEKVLLEYFIHLATKHKMKSSSLLNNYSIIKSLLNIKHGVDISSYTKVRAYLIEQGRDYKPKKAMALTKEEFDKFLVEAPDYKYLATKVVMLIGISGGCRREEVINLTMDDIHDMGTCISISITDTTANLTRNFNISGETYLYYFRKYAALRPASLDTRRFFLQYIKGQCIRQNMGINKIGSVPKVIASYLKLPNWTDYTGHSFRRTSSHLLQAQAQHLQLGLL